MCQLAPLLDITKKKKKLKNRINSYKKEYYVKLFSGFLLKNFPNLHSWYILGYF